MKNILIAAVIILTANTLQAQDRWLYWKYKDYGQVNFSIPRMVIHTGSWFVNDRQDRKMVQRVHKVRTMIFEDGSPVSERDFRKFNRKARHRHLEEIITVRDGKTRVQVLAKERRNTLKKVVVFVNSPEDGFFMVSVKGRLRLNDINTIINKYGKKGNGKKMIPDVFKNDSEKI
jgi:Domain of unknown function (DUF4252)